MFADTLPKRPDTLTSKGYERSEGNSDPFGVGVRKVWFRKRIDRPNIDDTFGWFGVSEEPRTELVFDIIIEYELVISDDPDATWEQNCSYSFEEVVLKVWERTLPDSDEDESAQRAKLRLVGKQTLRPESFRALETFAEILGYQPS
jgi:hypothetical protein